MNAAMTSAMRKAEKIKVFKKDAGVLAFVCERPAEELQSFRSFEKFIERRIAPEHGVGEYDLVGVNAKHKESPLGTVVVASIGPKRSREAGFATAHEAKAAFGGLIESAIAQGVQPRQMLPPQANEYLGWLLAGHPSWPVWSSLTVLGYTYETFTIESATSQITNVCLGFLWDAGQYPPQVVLFSGHEALYGTLRLTADRVRIAFAKEVQLLLSEQMKQDGFVDAPFDYNHLDRLIRDFEHNIYALALNSTYLTQTYPYYICNRDYAALWRDYVRDNSSVWGRP